MMREQREIEAMAERAREETVSAQNRKAHDLNAPVDRAFAEGVEAGVLYALGRIPEAHVFPR